MVLDLNREFVDLEIHRESSSPHCSGGYVSPRTVGDAREIELTVRQDSAT